MKQTLSSVDLFSLIKMLRAGTTKALLVVEGDSDSLTLSPHVNRSDVRVVPGYGRKSVEDTIAKADEFGIRGVVGLADSDIDRYFPDVEIAQSKNLIRTQNYDLESDIFYVGRVVDRMMESRIPSDEVAEKIESLGAESVVSAVTTIAAVVGLLRIHSRKNGHNLALRELPLKSFISKDVLDIDYAKLALLIKQKSKSTTLPAQRIADLLFQFSKDRQEEREVCCGHDLLNVLTGAFNSWWGVKVNYDMVCWNMRTALAHSELMSLRVYSELEAWGLSNSRRMWMYSIPGSPTAT